MTLAIEASGLVEAFGDTRAVDGVDLAVPPGAVYGFLVPNGAGKTTTIRMLATRSNRTPGRRWCSATTSSATPTRSVTLHLYRNARAPGAP